MGDLYPSFADVADEEGFPEIAATFRVYVSEKMHEEDIKLAENIENGLF